MADGYCCPPPSAVAGRRRLVRSLLVPFLAPEAGDPDLPLGGKGGRSSRGDNRRQERFPLARRCSTHLSPGLLVPAYASRLFLVCPCRVLRGLPQAPGGDAFRTSPQHAIPAPACAACFSLRTGVRHGAREAEGIAGWPVLSHGATRVLKNALRPWPRGAELVMMGVLPANSVAAPWFTPRSSVATIEAAGWQTAAVSQHAAFRWQ